MAKKKATSASGDTRGNISPTPCLIEILRKLGSHVSYTRIRLSRLRRKIRSVEKTNSTTTDLESERELLLSELERFEELLNDCVEWIHVRTGFQTNIILEVAKAPAFPRYKRTTPIYAGLNKLDERGENATLWNALLSRDIDALVCVKLLSPPDPRSFGHPALSPPKEKWPKEEYARDAIIRLKEEPELQSNISAFCRKIAEEQGIPEVAVSLKKLLYQPVYQKLWRQAK